MGFFDWLIGKKRPKEFEEEVKKSFSNVKKDFSKVSKWISHFDGKHQGHEEDIGDLIEKLQVLEKDFEEIKTFMEFFIAETSTGPFKTPFRRLSKHLSKQVQTPVQTGAVQTPVQTPVQTGFQTPSNQQSLVLKGLTMMERVVLFVLLNSKEKLSYEDIAALIGKDRSTVRGQINNIKQKSEGLIEEVMESDGKKRFFVEELLKERVLDDIILSKKSKKVQKIEKLQFKKPMKKDK